jgi:hypothetical protein
VISIPFNIYVYNFIILKYFSVQISSQSKGFVSVWKRSTYQYGLVCADNFDVYLTIRKYFIRMPKSARIENCNVHSTLILVPDSGEGM